MKTSLLELLSAQTTLLQQSPESPLRLATLHQLAKTVPAPVLAHFLRLVEQGRGGVALVRHGVCSGCHLRIPFGQAAALLKPGDLHLCENCGSYLLLAPEEQVEPAPHPLAAGTAPRRNASSSYAADGSTHTASIKTVWGNSGMPRSLR